MKRRLLKHHNEISYGIFVLKMAALGIQGNGESGNVITMEAINKTLQSIENPLQRVRSFSSS